VLKETEPYTAAEWKTIHTLIDQIRAGEHKGMHKQFPLFTKQKENGHRMVHKLYFLSLLHLIFTSLSTRHKICLSSEYHPSANVYLVLRKETKISCKNFSARKDSLSILAPARIQRSKRQSKTPNLQQLLGIIHPKVDSLFL